MKCVTHMSPSGEVIIRYATDWLIRREGSIDAAMTYVVANDVPAGSTNINIVSLSDARPHRGFRSAWELDENGKVSINIEKARIQRLREIRAARNQRLDVMDKDFVKALSRNEDAATLMVKMQALRDIPQTIDLSTIQTPEQLAEFEPNWPK